MKKYFKEGDTCKAICETCKKVVKAVMKYKNVPFSDGNGIVNNILVGVCVQCETIVSIPHQSTPEIKKAYEDR